MVHPQLLLITKRNDIIAVLIIGVKHTPPSLSHFNHTTSLIIFTEIYLIHLANTEYLVKKIIQIHVYKNSSCNCTVDEDFIYVLWTGRKHKKGCHCPSYGALASPWHFHPLPPWPHAKGKSGLAKDEPFFHTVPWSRSDSRLHICAKRERKPWKSTEETDSYPWLV